MKWRVGQEQISPWPPKEREADLVKRSSESRHLLFRCQPPVWHLDPAAKWQRCSSVSLPGKGIQALP